MPSCPVCGESFPAVNRRKIYCSVKCSDLFQYAKKSNKCTCPQKVKRQKAFAAKMGFNVYTEKLNDS